MLHAKLLDTYPNDSYYIGLKFSSSEDPLKWQFVDQFVSESGVREVFFYTLAILFYTDIKMCPPCSVLFSGEED